MSNAETIRTIKSQTLGLIREITENPKPAYWIDDQRVYWDDYLKQLQAVVAWCDEQLAGEEPFETGSVGYT